nr:MAG TPA: hypothetical protein [Caudoviricetes sp.]
MLKNKTEWAYSLNGIDYGDVYDNKEAAFKDALEEAKEYGYDTFFLGIVERFVPRVDIAEALIFSVQEQAREVVGEYRPDYLESASQEELNELNHKIEEVFFEWTKKHLHHPTYFFYYVPNAEEYDVDEED